jgi:hypothetical protein
MQVLANFMWVTAISVTARRLYTPAGFVVDNLPDRGRRFISPWRFAQVNLRLGCERAFQSRSLFQQTLIVGVMADPDPDH